MTPSRLNVPRENWINVFWKVNFFYKNAFSEIDWTHCTHTVRWRELEAKRRCDWYAEIDVSNSCCIGSRHLRHRRQCSSGTAWTVKIVTVILQILTKSRADTKRISQTGFADSIHFVLVLGTCATCATAGSVAVVLPGLSKLYPHSSIFNKLKTTADTALSKEVF